MNKIWFKLVRLPIPWSIRRCLSKIISRLLFFRNRGNSPVLSMDSSKMKHLVDNGYLIVENFLSEKQIQEILDSVDEFKLFDPWDDSIEHFSPNSPNEKTHVGYYKKDDLNKLSIIKDLSESNKIHGYLSKYLGGKFKCVNTSMWWTFGGKVHAQEAENFHRDLDNVFWLKAFVYLTDVDTNSGPHSYIPKSHKVNKSLTFKRFSDFEAKKVFGDAVLHTGKRGTLILEDTFGIHKGQHIKNDQKRLLLQFQYAVLNNPTVQG